MEAALSASDDTVTLLVSLGASADKIDHDGEPALIYAIMSKSVSTINLLAPLTQENLGRALHELARKKIQLMTGQLRQLVERAVQNREAAIALWVKKGT